MRIIKANYEILKDDKPMEYIERIGRLCYKSEDKITDTSAEKFINDMFRNCHMAMLEHYRFIVKVSSALYYSILMMHPRYLNMTSVNGRFIISGSARTLFELWESTAHDTLSPWGLIKIICAIVDHYDCQTLFGMWDTDMSDDQVEVIPHSMSYLDCSLKYGMTHIEYLQHQWMSVRFVCDRGVSHEIVRHRDASFAQESTRYCNYSQDKFGNEVTFIEPCFWNIHITGDTDRSYCSVDWEDAMRTSEQLYCSVDWEDAMRTAEQLYFTILKQGSTPQEARSVLPNSLKTELVMTATMQEWCHFFNLRALGKTGKPHPQMLELALPLYHECVDKEIIKG